MVTTDPNVDHYIAAFPKTTQAILTTMRQTIHQVLPGGTEAISYGIPAVKVNGKSVVYFSGWKHHVSLHPVPQADAALAKAMQPYVAGRGTLRFDLEKPIPYDLIKKVTLALAQDRGGTGGAA